MDKLTKDARSKNMASIHSKNTTPELQLRTSLFKEGFRYRLHKKNLPGKPDIVLAKYKTVIFVHGCFWHSHSGCTDGRLPKSRQEYWIPKLAKNLERDLLHEKELNKLGWNVIIVWECDIKLRKQEVIEAIKQKLIQNQ